MSIAGMVADARQIVSPVLRAASASRVDGALASQAVRAQKPRREPNDDLSRRDVPRQYMNA